MILWSYIKENMERTPWQFVCEDGAKMRYEDIIIWAESFADKLKDIKSCMYYRSLIFRNVYLQCFARAKNNIGPHRTRNEHS